ncbi:kelch-like protein [Raccoonpox virus]|uniref:Kelch-like protein n=1 Tax=Raccoon poxvirus TaxID=10256 RepID=A0A0G3G4N1_RACVI|nr:Kelch-like protein [Raccoonpox virus]AKJ93816.1 Kelch-like protein [Raccoonpox virus]AOP31449.1 kelch-like protein [Raccoonpox virus]
MDSITITVGQSVISSNVHKLVNKSSYFAEILKCGDATNNIILYDFQEDIITRVMQFINTDIIKIKNIKDAESMIHHSRQLGIESLINECQIYLLRVLSIHNCLEIYRITNINSLSYIYNDVRNFILDNILLIYTDPDFTYLPKYIIIDLLSDDNLNVFNEDNVVKIIYTYISTDIYKDISDILPVIRWNHLSPEWLTDMEWKLGNVDKTIIHKKRFYCGIITVNYNSDKGLMIISKHGSDLETEFMFSIKTDVVDKFETIYFNKKIYIIGGVKRTGKASNQVLSVDVSTKRLTIEPSLNDKRIGAAATVVNGRIYVIGGRDGSNYLNTVESWKPTDCTWRYEIPINYKRSNASAVSVNNTIFVTGGLYINDYNNTIVINNMEKLDICEDKQWSIIDMPMARVYHGIESTFGMLYLAGGLSVTKQYGNLEKSNEISCYNPRTNKWFDISYTIYKRSMSSLCKLNNVFYVFSKDIGYVEKYDGAWKLVHDGIPAIRAFSTSPY